jgi:hypothetical protein
MFLLTEGVDHTPNSLSLGYIVYAVARDQGMNSLNTIAIQSALADQAFKMSFSRNIAGYVKAKLQLLSALTSVVTRTVL